MNENATNYSLSSELLSFKKSISSNNRQAIEKYLCQIKNLPEDFLNQALFWCIQNYKVEQQTDECLHILLRYTSEINKSKANPNCQINLQTPLMAACKKGQLSLVKRLIQNGAKPDLTNSENKHPFQLILDARQQNHDVAEYFVSQMHSANLHVKKKHIIAIAAQKQFSRIFKAILDKGCELSFDNQNILHCIMKQKFKNVKKKKKILKQLISKHALFTQLDQNGKTPIQYQQNEQIRSYYFQNFKIKKVPQALLSSLQKPLNNGSSLFINQKLGKKQSKPFQSQKKKHLQQGSSNIGKQIKQFSRQVKGHGKQLKEEDLSFQDDQEDKSQGQLEQQVQKTMSSTKIHNSSKGDKKTVTSTVKNLNNSSFVSNSSNGNPAKEANRDRQQNNASLISTTTQNNTANKMKSRYSGIGPKTQTNLKSHGVNKKNLDYNQKTESKRHTGSNFNHSNNKQLNSKKKNGAEQQKKQTGAKKIVFHDQKTSFNHSSKQFVDEFRNALKQEKISDEENQTQTTIIQDSTPLVDLSTKIDSKQIKISEALKSQSDKPVPALHIKDDNSLKLPLKLETHQDEIQTKKAEWEITLQKCQKIMGELIVKQQQYTSDLKDLKSRFSEVFHKYWAEKNVKIQWSQSQKLKQLKVCNNEISKMIPQQNIKQIREATKDQSLVQNFLADQILVTQQKCADASEQKTAFVDQAIQLISKKIYAVLQSARKQIIQVSIQTYGSRANGLQTQTSDIDLLIVCNINAGVKDLMCQLERSGIFNSDEINEVKFLTNTSMPIMKICLNEKYMHLNVDLTFQIRGHTGLRCTALIKQFITAEKLLKPLVVALKTLLNCYELCDTYTGGLGSYSLTLMTIALLQFTEIKKKEQNLGQIFLQFLLFYGFQMDYICQAIIIYPPGFNEKPAFSIYQLPYSLDLTPKLIIYDPLNPVNNVGRATYRIVQLKKLFKIWYVKLKTELFDKPNGFQQLIRMKNELLAQTNTVQL